MTQKTTAQLTTDNDANINTNGVNAITGALHNTMNKDMIDSMLNKSTDTLLIVANVYRAGTKAITTAQTQITFSLPALASNNYQVMIIDSDGVGWGDITDKQTTGFKITGLSSGTIGWAVFLNL